MFCDSTVSVMDAVMSQEQRSYIKIKFQHNKTAKEIFSACSTYALSYSQVSSWVNEFKIGG